MPESAKMQPFTLNLSNDRIINGLISTPTTPSHKASRPLVVTLHGGTYDAAYFNSIESVTSALNLPVISLHRPNYGGSTPLPALQHDQTFMQETGRLLHNEILPALWQQYGEATGSSTIVLHTHSIGSCIGIIVSGLHGQETTSNTSYPLAGLSICGIGIKPKAAGPTAELLGIFMGAEPVPGPASLWPTKLKTAAMLRPAQCLCDADAELLNDTLNRPFPDPERDDMVNAWFSYWEGYAKDVRVPVLYGLPEHDCLWYSGKEEMRGFMDVFQNSRGVSGGVILQAPHSAELSRQGRAWYTKVCGFAMECAVADGLTGLSR